MVGVKVGNNRGLGLAWLAADRGFRGPAMHTIRALVAGNIATPLPPAIFFLILSACLHIRRLGYPCAFILLRSSLASYHLPLPTSYLTTPQI
jgi:hypothetical protein